MYLDKVYNILNHGRETPATLNWLIT